MYWSSLKYHHLLTDESVQGRTKHILRATHSITPQSDTVLQHTILRHMLLRDILQRIILRGSIRQLRDREDTPLIVLHRQLCITQWLDLSLVQTMECKWHIFSTKLPINQYIWQDTKSGINQGTRKAILQFTVLVIIAGM